MSRLTGRPRASGGGSWAAHRPCWPYPSAPRQRGWFSAAAADLVGGHVGPAPAGVVRDVGPVLGRHAGRPRASGGGSAVRLVAGDDSTSAPRQRGWFPRAERGPSWPPVGPAPAGVVQLDGIPGRAMLRRPRASGGGSLSRLIRDANYMSAPRQRGWFEVGGTGVALIPVGPAPAGVVRRTRHPASSPPRRPRASGGGSCARWLRRGLPGSAPRQRGWFYLQVTSVTRNAVGPAPAGVVRSA